MDNPVQELLQCAICLSQLSRPRILPCFHSFCETCLSTHIQTRSTNPDYSYTTNFLCPTCRVQTQVPRNGASQFPFDFRLVKFTDMLKKIVHRKKEDTCSICILGNEYKLAISFCAECQKYLCRECGIKHHTTPVLSCHFLLDLTLDSQNAEPACNRHREEPAKYVCNTCNTNLCVVCVLGEHENHSIANLNGSTASERLKLHGNLNHLNGAIWKIHETLFHLTCLEGRLKGLYEESRMQIKKQSRKLVNRIMGDEGKLLKELDQIYQSKTEEVFAIKEECRECLISYETLQSQVGCLLRSENLQNHMEKYPDLMDKLKKTNIEKCYESQWQSSNLQSFVKFIPKNTCFSNMGKFVTVDLKQESRKLTQRHSFYATEHEDHEETTHQTAISISNASAALDRQMMTIPHTLSLPVQSLIPVTLVSIFGGHGHDTGQLSLPYNICFTSDDNIIVAENGNKRLQIFDMKGESLGLLANGEIIPRCVTTTPTGQIAVTDEKTKSLKVLNQDGSLQKTFIPAGSTFPYGLASTSTGDFVFTDMIFENVTVISPSGDLKVQFGCHGNSDNRFDNPGYIAVGNNDKIFVSDSCNHVVKVFRRDGYFLFKIACNGNSDGKLRYPKAIALDYHGNIFIVDSGNDRIALFSKSGKFLGTVIDRHFGLQRPTGLAYSPSGFLAVSMPDINEIRVYKIENLGDL